MRALGAPTLEHLDPQYLAIMDETCQFLRQVFRTRNPLTFPVSGTGMAGMECVAVNLIEPGDQVIVCVNGVFGGRMKDVMERCGATVHAIEAAWGDVFAKEQIAAAFEQHPKAKLLGIVHAETSTGAHQPLTGLADFVHARGALLVVDTVTSLGGHEVRVDEWGIDAIYSGTQKCLSCPPGFRPSLSASAPWPAWMRARPSRSRGISTCPCCASTHRRRVGVRFYHHTAPGQHDLRAARGAADRRRGGPGGARSHATNKCTAGFAPGSKGWVLRYVPKQSLHTLNCISIPAGADDAQSRRRLLEEYGIEIGGGPRPMAGQAWRIGLMGHGASGAQCGFSLDRLARDIALTSGP